LTSREKRRRFEDTVVPLSASAYNLARWLTGGDQDAQDVVQESFLRAFTSFDSLRADDPRPWLLTIVRNTSFTWLKRNRPAAAWRESDDLLAETPAPAANPEALLLALSDVSRVRAAVESLPPDYRSAIVLREFEDLSYKEIAAVTGVPIGTVMSRRARARECLKRALEGERPK
jgi:RNA polymerase sigma-70 factor (ECF subfamily)